MKINSQPSPHSSLLPLGNPKKLTIHTISQSLTLSNFFYKTPGKFKIGHNIGKVEIYENKFSTFSPFLPPTPGWSLKIWLFTQLHNLWPCLTFSTRQGVLWKKLHIVKVKLCEQSNIWGLPRGRRKKWGWGWKFISIDSQPYLCCSQYLNSLCVLWKKLHMSKDCEIMWIVKLLRATQGQEEQMGMGLRIHFHRSHPTYAVANLNLPGVL